MLMIPCSVQKRNAKKCSCGKMLQLCFTNATPQLFIIRICQLCTQCRLLLTCIRKQRESHVGCYAHGPSDAAHPCAAELGRGGWWQRSDSSPKSRTTSRQVAMAPSSPRLWTLLVVRATKEGKLQHSWNSVQIFVWLTHMEQGGIDS